VTAEFRNRIFDIKAEVLQMSGMSDKNMYEIAEIFLTDIRQE
jgi:hypothetical protein